MVYVLYLLISKIGWHLLFGLDHSENTKDQKLKCINFVRELGIAGVDQEWKTVL